MPTRNRSGSPSGPALPRTLPADPLRRAGLARGVLLLAALAGSRAVGAATGTAVADPMEGDPYRTYSWPDMRRVFLEGQPAVFDERVKVEGPAFAVDPMTVPITVDASALGPVQRIVVLVDRNPIRKVLEFEPLLAAPAISFRFKLEQASPVRAAVLADDGRWHVGQTLVDSAGGGCTVAGATRKDGSWSQTLMQMRARLFSRGERQLLAAAPGASGPVGLDAMPEAAARLRLHLMHPMDTGLVSGIPAFYISQLEVRDALERELLRVASFEPVSENPVFSFDFRDRPAGPLRVRARDNNGNRLDAEVAT